MTMTTRRTTSPTITNTGEDRPVVEEEEGAALEAAEVQAPVVPVVAFMAPAAILDPRAARTTVKDRPAAAAAVAAQASAVHLHLQAASRTPAPLVSVQTRHARTAMD